VASNRSRFETNSCWMPKSIVNRLFQDGVRKENLDASDFLVQSIAKTLPKKKGARGERSSRIPFARSAARNQQRILAPHPVDVFHVARKLPNQSEPSLIHCGRFGRRAP